MLAKFRLVGVGVTRAPTLGEGPPEPASGIVLSGLRGLYVGVLLRESSMESSSSISMRKDAFCPPEEGGSGSSSLSEPPLPSARGGAESKEAARDSPCRSLLPSLSSPVLELAPADATSSGLWG